MVAVFPFVRDSEGRAGVVRARILVLALQLSSTLAAIAIVLEEPAGTKGGTRKEREDDEQDREEPGHNKDKL